MAPHEVFRLPVHLLTTRSRHDGCFFGRKKISKGKGVNVMGRYSLRGVSFVVVIAMLLALLPLAFISSPASAALAWDSEGLGSSHVFDTVWDGTELWAALDGGVYSYNPGTTTWTHRGGPVSVLGVPFITSLAWDGSDIYAGSSYGYAHQYVSGTTWNSIGQVNGTWMPVYTLEWHGGTLYAGGGNLFVSGYVSWWDGVTTWTDTACPTTDSVTDLQSNGGTDLFASSQDQHVYRYDTSGAPTWNDDGIVAAGFPVNCLAWNGTQLMAGCEDGDAYNWPMFHCMSKFENGVFILEIEVANISYHQIFLMSLGCEHKYR